MTTGTVSDTVIFDTDTHLTEPPDLWTARLPAKWGDQIMQVRTHPDTGREHWTVNGQWLGQAWGSCQYEWNKFPIGPATRDECHPAAVDQTERVKLMDHIGVKTAVLYPNVAGLNQSLFSAMADVEVALAHIQAWNDYQLEYCAGAPGRFLPMLVVPFWHLDASVAEIERLTGRGFGGIVMTGAPQIHGEPFIGDPHWNRLWEATLAAGLTVSFHIGNGDLKASTNRDQWAIDLPGASLTRAATFPFLDNGKQVTDLVMSGVLARYPDLKFASVESGLGWIPFVLECMDYHYKRSTQGTGNLPWGDLLPSDLFRRQVYVNFWFEELQPWHIEAIGEDNILFETDFPHPTCLGPAETEHAIEVGLGAWPDAIREKILWRNAAALYGLDPVTGSSAG